MARRVNAASRVFQGQLYFDPSGYRVGAQGIGSTASGYRAPPGLDIPSRPRVRSTQFSPEEIRSGVFGTRTPYTTGDIALARSGAGVVAPWNRGDPRYDPEAAAALAQSQKAQAAQAAKTVDVAAIRGQSAAARQSLAEQRGGLENVRAQLIDRLTTTQYDRRGRARTVTDPRVAAQISGIDARLRDVGAQERRVNRLDDLNVAQAFHSAAAAEKDLQNQRHLKAASDTTGMFNALTNLESQYKRGTPEFRQGALAIRDQFPDAGITAVKALHDSAALHDKTEERGLAKMTANLQRATGLTPEEFARLNPNAFAAGAIVEQKAGQAVTHLGESGFSKEGKPKGEFSTATAALIPPEYAGKPFDQIPQEVKDQINQKISGGGAIQIQTGKGYNVVIPRTQFENFKSTFMPEPTGMQQPTIDVQAKPFPPNYVPGVGTVDTAPQAPQGTINGPPAQQAIDEIRSRVRGPAQPAAVPEATVQPAAAPAATPTSQAPVAPVANAAPEPPKIRRYNPETGQLE